MIINNNNNNKYCYHNHRRSPHLVGAVRHRVGRAVAGFSRYPRGFGGMALSLAAAHRIPVAHRSTRTDGTVVVAV